MDLKLHCQTIKDDTKKRYQIVSRKMDDRPLVALVAEMRSKNMNVRCESIPIKFYDGAEEVRKGYLPIGYVPDEDLFQTLMAEFSELGGNPSDHENVLEL